MDGWTAVAIGGLAGLADLAGGALAGARRSAGAPARPMLALAAGFLLGSAFFHMLPRAMASTPAAPLLVAAGYGLLYAAERLLVRHGHAAPQPTTGMAALAGLLVHTFLDGAAIGAAFVEHPRTGLLVFLAVASHKLPEGFSLAALVLAAGGAVREAVLAAGAIGLSTLAGSAVAVMSDSWGGGMTGSTLALAAGSFLYIGATELAPAAAGGRRSGWLVLGGMAAVWSLSRWLHGLGL